MSFVSKCAFFVLFCNLCILPFDRSGLCGDRAQQEKDANEMLWLEQQRIAMAAVLEDAQAAFDACYYDQAILLYQSIVNNPFLNTAQGYVFKVRVFVGLGRACYRAERWGDAMQILQQAVEWAHPNFQSLKAEALFYLGCLTQRGDGRVNGNAPDLDVAVRYYEFAMINAHESNNLDVFFKSVLASARVYRERHDVHRAMARYGLVLSHATASEHIQYFRQAQLAIGIFCPDLGRAKHVLEQIQPQGIDDVIYGQACFQLIAVALREGKSDVAGQYYQAALNCEHVPEIIKAQLRNIYGSLLSGLPAGAQNVNSFGAK